MDKRKALKYYIYASEKGLPEAQYNLGVMYYQGDGTERDVGEARKLWERSAKQNFQPAQDIMMHARN